MMNALRNNAKMFLWFIIGAFVLSIVFVWGMKSSFSSKQNPEIVARIGDDVIQYQEIGTPWRNLAQQLYDKGEKVSEEEEKKYKKEILDELIGMKLQLRLAEKLNITTSDREIAESIMNIKAFHTDNKFDENKYYQILASQRIRIQDFEAQQSQNIILTKLGNLINASVKTTNSEVKDYYLKRHRKIKTKYVYFDYNNYLSELKVGEERMKDYYAMNKKNYAKPERVEASHILILTDASPTSPTGRTEEQAEKLAKNILVKLNNGESFSKLAKKYSGDPGSKDKGGDLGWFEKGRMVPEFEKAAFSTKKGSISDIAKTQFGFHIIKVKDKEKGFEPTYQGVKNKIKKEMQKQDGLKLVSRKADAFLKLVKEKSFEEAINESKIKAITTSTFDIDADMKSIKSGNYKDVIFDLTKGKVSTKVDGDDGIYVFKIISERPAKFSKKKFAEEKEDLNALLKNIKFKQINKDTIDALKAETEVVYYYENL